MSTKNMQSLDNPDVILAKIEKLKAVREACDVEAKELSDGLTGFIKKLEEEANKRISAKQGEVQKRLVELNTKAVEANGTIHFLETHLATLAPPVSTTDDLVADVVTLRAPTSGKISFEP